MNLENVGGDSSTHRELDTPTTVTNSKQQQLEVAEENVLQTTTAVIHAKTLSQTIAPDSILTPQSPDALSGPGTQDSRRASPTFTRDYRAPPGAAHGFCHDGVQTTTRSRSAAPVNNVPAAVALVQETPQSSVFSEATRGTQVKVETTNSVMKENGTKAEHSEGVMDDDKMIIEACSEDSPSPETAMIKSESVMDFTTTENNEENGTKPGESVTTAMDTVVTIKREEDSQPVLRALPAIHVPASTALAKTNALPSIPSGALAAVHIAKDDNNDNNDPIVIDVDTKNPMDTNMLDATTTTKMIVPDPAAVVATTTVPTATVAPILPPPPATTSSLVGTKRPQPSTSVSTFRSPATAASSTATTATAPTEPALKKPATSSLQQQIQQQLQQQLQAQLQAAAARGQQANITPAQIQAQAQAMVQAAAQAQAVVAAAKARGDGLAPMNAAQVAALSQIQAQAIVHARNKQQQTNNVNAPVPTPQQIQTQIQLQAQALVHAHTQAQIQAGIYKGDTNTTNKERGAGSTAVATKPSASVPTVIMSGSVPSPLPPSSVTRTSTTASLPTSLGVAPTPVPSRASSQTEVSSSSHAVISSNAGAMTVNPLSTPSPLFFTPAESNSQAMVPAYDATSAIPPLPQVSATSPQFLAQLEASLNQFWQGALQEITRLENQTEHHFKNHNDLPLARIKRIMKSDEDVRMISAEAPVLFAKACELFILDLSIRSWNYSQLHRRRTLQKEDVKEAIQRTDIFDFLVDVIH